jgi:hypothetical protein
MIPDFPDVRGIARARLRRLLIDAASGKTGPLSAAKYVVAYECSSYEQHRFDGSIDKQRFVRARSTVVLKAPELKEEGLGAVLREYHRARTDIGEQQKRLLFHRLAQITQETGQSVDAGGKPLTPELLLEMLDRMEIDFDAEGRPIWPSIICHPSQQEAILNWDVTEEQTRQLEELIERKWRAWRDRESDRRLVD